ncbi:NADPH--cytochrome P450 reductase [Oopsacas minuta]|uniref:NADPH--cytochrome P450 reductase n=1 Tax=Oopsacas minuta TaxID=111878 RepID=A0AAV7JLA4_9METZ|nr:NADPH--cytochrome P450 reductase [Oopsacas minuta]
MSEEQEEISPEGGWSEISIFDVFILLSITGLICVFIWYKYFRKDPTKIRTLSLSIPKVGNAIVSRSFYDRAQSGGHRVVVFYGSQTGTAEAFASRIAKECKGLGLGAFIYDPEDCDEWDQLAQFRDMNNSVGQVMAVFCMATYGVGDPTDNSIEFIDWLKSTDLNLSGLSFAVFGLGNKTYEFYNEIGRIVDKRLDTLGATRLCPRGEGDADGNIEEDFLKWRDVFKESVIQLFEIDPDSIGQFVGRDYDVVFHSNEELDKLHVYTGEPYRPHSFEKQNAPFDAKNPILAEVTCVRELHTGGDRSCLHMELNISGAKMKYQAGDHMALYVQNEPHLVEKLAKRLGVDLDQVISLNAKDELATKKHPFPCPCSFRTALTHYIDLTSLPKTHLIKELSNHTLDPSEKENILELTESSEQGRRKYQEFVLDTQRSLLSLLDEFPSVQPPVDLLLEMLPRLQCRYYSISSSPKLHPNSIHITAVLTDYTTPLGHSVTGVASAMFRDLASTRGITATQPGYRTITHFPIYVRKSTFKLPLRPIVPIIMIGPGTGLAPFRGFLQERGTVLGTGREVGRSLLFFGCRKRNWDYIYEQELNEFKENGILSNLQLAFSREQEKKIYVQHLMNNISGDLFRLLKEEGAYIYVCGDARNMARDVHANLLLILEQEGGMGSEDAALFVKNLQNRNRYQLDVWS